MINNLYIKATPTVAAVTWGSITGTLSAQTDLQNALNAKQVTLVSGTNIKTVNSTSLLGAGDVSVGTVTSVGVTAGTGISVSGSPITSSGSITVTNSAPDQVVALTAGTGIGVAGTYPNFTVTNSAPSSGGTVTSVGLTMPSAFSVASSPVTTSGTLAVTGSGTVSQYVRGDGSLANFPESTGGGSSLAFYLNGSVAQGTIGGIAFKEMDRTPILGTGTDFTIAADGYIQSFITDANVPNQLQIPAGNWNFETYFSASSSGGTPSFYVELYKWNGTTLSLIASNSATPEGITNGTTIDAYFSALAVPQTTLAATDRLAIRIYVTHSGKTITLHTENSHLCEVITTFSTGLTALNGLTAQVQNFATGTSGTDFGISSATSTHTFNLPTASAANRGALSSADWTTFNNKQAALVSGTNIKTINGTSVLGSGDLVVSGGGGASGIHGFITQSTFGVTAILTNSGTNTATPASDTMYAYPLIMANNYTFNSMQIYCQTALTSGTCRILVYSNLNSNPDQKLYESATIDLSTTGTKTITNTMTFTKGTVYWLVLHAGLAGSPLSIRSISGLTQMVTGYRSNNAPYSTIQQNSVVPLGSAPITFGAYAPSSLNSPLIALFQ